MSAYEVAIVLAGSHRPELLVDEQIDVPAARDLRRVASTGNGVMLDLILSLAGEGPVELHRLDALDRDGRALVAAAMRHL